MTDINDIAEKITSAAQDATLCLERVFKMPIQNCIILPEFMLIAKNWGTPLDYSVSTEYPEYGNFTKINKEDRL